MFTFSKNFFLLHEELFHNYYRADIRQFLVFIILEYIILPLFIKSISIE